MCMTTGGSCHCSHDCSAPSRNAKPGPKIADLFKAARSFCLSLNSGKSRDQLLFRVADSSRIISRAESHEMLCRERWAIGSTCMASIVKTFYHAPPPCMDPSHLHHNTPTALSPFQSLKIHCQVFSDEIVIALELIDHLQFCIFGTNSCQRRPVYSEKS